VNRFGWNLEHSEYIVGRWLWQILGTIRAVASAEEPGEFFVFFCQVKWLYRFPVDQISQNLNTTHRSVSWWKLSEENFENFPVRGRFSKKAKISFFQLLATSGRHNSAMVIDRRKFITKWSFYGTSSFHFYRWNKFKFIPLACTCTSHEKSTPKFLVSDATSRQATMS